MFFKEYRQPKLPKDFDNRDYLYHLLPWATIYENKEFFIEKDKEIFHFPIIITKDGSFQTTFRIRGKDLDSCTPYELININNRMNNTLLQLEDNWTFHINAIRKKSKKYIGKKKIKNIPLKIIELEREEFFKSGQHYESEYYITFTWLTPEDNIAKAKSLFFTKSDEVIIHNIFQENVKHYNNELLKIFTLLASTLNECEVLDIDKTISYYHSLISDSNHDVKVPRAFYYNNEIIAIGSLPGIYEKLNKNNIKEEILPVFIDTYITDTELTGGIEPKIGDDYISTVSILNFPGSSMPGMLDILNRSDMSYIWNTRYIMLSKATAQETLDKYWGKWFSAKETIKAMFLSVFFKTQSSNENVDAINKAFQVKRKRVKIDNDEATLGYYSTTFVLKGKNKAEVESTAQRVKTMLNSLGFIAQIEGFYTLDTWLSTMPGNTFLNERKPFIDSPVLSHLIPLNAVWAGDEWNKHLKEPSLLYCQTTGNTPFRLNLHYGDVGHTLIVGPTGSGKSVLLNTLQAAYLGYKNSKVICFDKGGSGRVLNKACNGLFYDLGTDNIRFQPLRDIGIIESNINIDKKLKELRIKFKEERKTVSEEELNRLAKELSIKTEEERAVKEREWAQEWIENILETNTIVLTPEIKTYIWNALTSVANLPVQERTLSSFSHFAGGQSKAIKDALIAYCDKGPYAKYFDGNSDFLKESNFVTFEMEKLLETKNALIPALDFLFHKIETSMIDKVNPVLLTLDEVWTFLKESKFASKIEEWLRVMRKNNVAVVFATQSLADIANSAIKSVILDQCYSRIYLPNSNAISEAQIAYYKMFDLNDREIEIIYNALPKRQYYFKNPKGSRLFELALSPLELAYIASSSGEEQEKCKELMSLNQKEFNIEWLNYKGYEGEIIVNKVEELIAND